MAAAIVRPCRNCGKPCARTKKRWPRDRKGNLCQNFYCDRSCYDTYRSAHPAGETRVCAGCGLPFRVYRSAERGVGTFCSWGCRLAAKRAKPKRCVNCRCLFTPVKPIRRTSGIEFVSHNGGKTCSAACARAWPTNNEERKRKISVAFSGARHPLWKGGCHNIGDRGPGWAGLRRRVLKRDRYRCQDCGLTDEDCRTRYGRSLDVDHVEPFHNFQSSREANTLGNLQARCASCHRKAEARRTNVQMVLPLGSSSRAGHRGPHRGEKVKGARLTSSSVLAIREAYAAGVPAQALADRYGVIRNTIYAVVRGTTWRHVGGSLTTGVRAGQPGARILKTADVLAARERRAAGAQVGVLAREFGVSITVMSSLLKGRSYVSEPGPLDDGRGAARGMRHGGAKLDEEQVRELRRNLGGLERLPYGAIKELARRFGVSRDTIVKIRSGQAWKHLVDA